MSSSNSPNSLSVADSDFFTSSLRSYQQQRQREHHNHNHNHHHDHHHRRPSPRQQQQVQDISLPPLQYQQLQQQHHSTLLPSLRDATKNADAMATTHKPAEVARTFRRDSATRNTGTWLSEPAVEQVLAGHLPPMLQAPGVGGFAGSPVSAERGAVRGETEVERPPPPQAKATEMRMEEGVVAAENKGAESARQWISPSGELLVDGGIVAKWETCVVVEGLGSCWATLRQDLVDLFEDHRVCGEAIIFGTAKSHLILVYLWTEEARQDAIVDLHNAVIEKTTRLQLRRGGTEDLNRALQLQSI